MIGTSAQESPDRTTKASRTSDVVSLTTLGDDDFLAFVKIWKCCAKMNICWEYCVGLIHVALNVPTV
jgi:hypothetical protein